MSFMKAKSPALQAATAVPTTADTSVIEASNAAAAAEQKRRGRQSTFMTSGGASGDTSTATIKVPGITGGTQTRLGG